jgi:hypothetical protein
MDGAAYLSGTTAKRPINISRIERSINVKVYPFKAFCLICRIMYGGYIISLRGKIAKRNKADNFFCRIVLVQNKKVKGFYHFHVI